MQSPNKETIDYLNGLTRTAVKAFGSRAAWLRKAHVSESTFYRWMRGHTEPNARTLRRLADAVAAAAERGAKRPEPFVATL